MVGGRPLWFCAITLHAEPSSAAAARRFVSEHLIVHDLPLLVEDVMLVASELATNAMVHARTPFTVRITGFADVVVLAVADGSLTTPTLRTAAPEDLAGRGIAIVTVLSRAWGVAPEGVGKSVWAEFAVA